MKLSSLECVKQCFGDQEQVDLEKQQAQLSPSTLEKLSSISKDAMSKLSELCSGAWNSLPSFSAPATFEHPKSKKE